MVSPARQVAFGSLKAGVRWPKVCGKEAENVDKGRLELEKLLGALFGADGGEVEMPPRVARDLVAFAVHALDEVGVRARGVGDGRAPEPAVVAAEEKGRLDAISAENIEQLLGVNVWAIVKRDGGFPGDGAPVDVDAVRNGAQVGTRHAGRVEAVYEAQCSDEEGCGGAGMHFEMVIWGLQRIASGKA